MKKYFSGSYDIDDGYARPHTQRFSVNAFEIEDDMTDGDLRSLYRDLAEDAFRQVGIRVFHENDFVEWARSVIAEREAQDRGEDAA